MSVRYEITGFHYFPPTRRYRVIKRGTLVSIGKLFASGLNTAQIAAKLGLTEAQVYNARLNRSRA